MPSVIVTGADRGLGLSLCKEYLNRGWTVFAGKYLEDYTLLEDLQITQPNLHIVYLDMSDSDSIKSAAGRISEVSGSLDMMISNAALMNKVECSLYEPPMDLEAVWNSFEVNALGPLLLTEAVLPLMADSEYRRLCYISSEVSSIVLMRHSRDGGFPYPMSKTAMNMGIRMMHNQLWRDGYRFRLFHPGWMKKRQADGTLSDGAKYDPDDIGRTAALYFDSALDDEHRLVMVDYNGQEWTY